MRPKAVLLLVLGALSFAAGCAPVGIYFRDRAADFGDIFVAEVSVGYGLEAHLYLTQDIGTALGYGRNYGVGWRGRDIRIIRRGAVGWLIFGVVDYEAEGVFKGDKIEDAFWLYWFEREPMNRRIPTWAHYIEGGGTLGLVGLHAGFSPVEFADFVTGWFGLDIRKDDYYPGLPDGKWVSFVDAVSQQRDDVAVRYWLERGADPNERASLHRAENAQIVKALIEYGADVNMRDQRGDTPLHIAARKAVHRPRRSFVEIERIKYILDAGADINARNDKGETPLMAAAASRHTRESILYLLERGADARAETIDGSNVLHYLPNYKGVVEALLEAGADPEKINDDGLTPLHRAVSASSRIVLRCLLEAGVGVDIRGPDGATPLQTACGPPVYDESGALVPIDRWSVHVASHRTIAELLISHKADLNARDKHGSSPLHRAMHSGRFAIAEVLLENGADPDAVDNYGRTPRELIDREREAEYKQR